MDWDVVEVRPISDHSLYVRFADGTQGTVQFEQSHLTGVFQVLKDAAVFRQVYIDSGAVAWPGNIDLAPDALYRVIRQSGRCVLA